MTPALLAKRRAEYDSFGGPSTVDVDLGTFMCLSIELSKSYPEAFHAHCAEVCMSIEEAIADTLDSDDPSRLCDRTVGQLERFDISDRRAGLGAFSKVSDNYSYGYLYKDGATVVCAELRIHLLGADDRIYSTTVHVPTAGPKYFLQTSKGTPAAVLYSEKVLALTLREPGLKAYPAIQALGHSLTESATWAMLTASIDPTASLQLPDF